MFFPRITEMDGRGGLFVEVAGGVEGFKHQIMCVLLRMISEVLNICDRVMKGKRHGPANSGNVEINLGALAFGKLSVIMCKWQR